MGTKERTWHAAVDSPEQIQMCLNCEKSRCTDCITSSKKSTYTWQRKYVHKTEFYYVDGKRINAKAIELLKCYPHLNTDVAIGKNIGVTYASVCGTRKRLGLPRADAPFEEKMKLSKYYLDEIEKQKGA